MDAKNKAKFILSSTGPEVTCPSCGARNKPSDEICSSCGGSLVKPAAETTPAFTQKQNESKPVVTVVEETSAFAQGLPAWDLVPPQVVVRRR